MKRLISFCLKLLKDTKVPVYTLDFIGLNKDLIARLSIPSLSLHCILSFFKFKKVNKDYFPDFRFVEDLFEISQVFRQILRLILIPKEFTLVSLTGHSIKTLQSCSEVKTKKVRNFRTCARKNLRNHKYKGTHDKFTSYIAAS